MARSRGWLKVLKPWLEGKQNKTYPSPFDFVKEEEFLYAAKVASLEKKVIGEILSFVAEKEAAEIHYAKKEKGEEDFSRVGR